MIPVDYPKQLPLFGVVVTKGATKESEAQTFSSADNYTIKVWVSVSFEPLCIRPLF